MKDKMMYQLNRGKKEDVIIEYQRLQEQAGKKVQTKTELKKFSKEQLVDKCLRLRNKLIIFGWSLKARLNDCKINCR